MDLNSKCWNTKFLDAGENLVDSGFGDNFLDTTPKAGSQKDGIKMLAFIKIKFFYSAKDTAKRKKRLDIDWEDIFAKDISDKGLLFRIYKELLNSTLTNNLLKNQQKTFKNTHKRRYTGGK